MKAKWLVLFLIWLMMLVAYFDRINLPQASGSIMHDLHLDKAQWGFVLATFTIGYGLMQAPGGFLADKFGSRRLLIVAILGWSVFTALTGIAGSLISALAIRFVFGIGEGLENGAQFRLVGEYFNAKERAFANAIFLSALALGPAIGTPLATWQVVQFGWRNMFFVFGALGFLVAIVLALWLPKDHRSGHAPDPAHAEEAAVPLASMFKGTSAKLCALGYLLFNVAFWGFLSWIPNYLRDDRHLSLAKSGVLGSLPYLAGVIGMALAGYLGSTSMSRHRPLLVAVCCACAALGLLFATSAPNVHLAVGGPLLRRILSVRRLRTFLGCRDWARAHSIEGCIYRKRQLLRSDRRVFFTDHHRTTRQPMAFLHTSDSVYGGCSRLWRDRDGVAANQTAKH